MASGQFGMVLREVQRLFSRGTVAGLSEGQLLERFVVEGDEVAFEAIVARHGPMVLGVCRRVLNDPDEVEDAFQATFLVLVRKAGSLRDRDLLANWLYGVAFLVAKRARANSSRRQWHERRGESIDAEAPAVDMDRHELQPVVHEELDRLPEKYRAPIVLCYLEGQTHEEAARLLHWPVGTVKGRLARARERLRDRLTRRGLALTGGTLAVSLSRDASALVPLALRDSTIQAALRVATGKGAVSATAAALMEGVIRSMFLTKMKMAAVGVLAVGTLATGAGVLARQGPGPDPKGRASGETDKPAHATVRHEPGGADTLAGLAEARVKAATWLLESEKSLHEKGQVSADQYIRASWRLMESQRDAASGPEERIAAAAEHLERMKELVRSESRRVEAGAAKVSDAAEADYARVEAEYRLAEMKAGRGEAGGASMMSPRIGGGGMLVGGGMMGGGGMGGRARMGGGPPNLPPNGDDPKSKAVLAKLESVVSMPFAEDTPLEDVIKYIQTATSDQEMPAGIPIYVDPDGLADATPEGEEPMTIKSTVKLTLEGVPLRRTLKLLVKQLGLDYIVRDGLIMVSTRGGLFNLTQGDPTPEK